MNKFSKKINAGTILEVIISSVMMTVVFSIAIMCYVNINTSGINMAEIKAMNLLEEEAAQIKKEKKFLNDVYNIDNISIEVNFYDWSGAQKIKLFEMKAIDPHSHKLAERKELIITE